MADEDSLDQIELSLGISKSQKRTLEMPSQTSDWGKRDSLRSTILSLVAQRNYERANIELDEFVAMKTEFPLFKGRVDRYVVHCHDLISAIKAKKSLSEAAFSMSKQQELHERSLQHFDDLKATLKMIEQVEREMRLDDVRSTVWVIKAAASSAIGILVIVFVLEFYRGIFHSGAVLFDQGITDLADYIFTTLGL